MGPPPTCDVVLHCGDLTNYGSDDELQYSLAMLNRIEAELKLVIAGNHEKDLDPRKTNPSDNPGFLRHKAAVDVMMGPWAHAAGVTYLTEGLNTFTLKNGAAFTVYSSPYTPAFCNMAFAYNRHDDRFNPAGKGAPGFRCIAENPIPDFPGVDIVMTHGPPRYMMDRVENGNAGCESLIRAVSRARPLLHCFGHIHEGYGAKLVQWNEDEELIGPRAIARVIEGKNDFPRATYCPVKFGKETIMVNAAITNSEFQPLNAPWLLTFELPKLVD